MKINQTELLLQGYTTAFLDAGNHSNLAYRPEFVSNNPKLGKKVLVSIERELSECDEFQISVAFVTKSGITPLLQTLEELEKKGIPGKFLTTDYLMFSEPEALKKLAELKNIELKMFRIKSQSKGFHTKGYIFKKEEIYRMIIGSSNMTLSAITRSKEWNTKIVSTINGEYTREVLEEFQDLWNDPQSQSYDEFISDYTEKYMKNKLIREQKQQALK